MKRNIFFLFILVCAMSAQAQTAASVLEIPASNTGTTTATGSYDRIETVRNIPQYQLTAFAVPATVDGYFFGADATRYVVKSITTEDIVTTIRASVMNDTVDFESGTLYLVRPEAGHEASRLYSYTAGIQTAVGTTQRDLECYPVTTQDVTREGRVTVDDVAAAVCVAMGKDSDQLYDHAIADQNADGSVTADDITPLVDAVLTGRYTLLVVE